MILTMWPFLLDDRLSWHNPKVDWLVFVMLVEWHFRDSFGQEQYRATLSDWLLLKQYLTWTRTRWFVLTYCRLFTSSYNYTEILLQWTTRKQHIGNNSLRPTKFTDKSNLTLQNSRPVPRSVLPDFITDESPPYIWLTGWNHKSLKSEK